MGNLRVIIKTPKSPRRKSGQPMVELDRDGDLILQVNNKHNIPRDIRSENKDGPMKIENDNSEDLLPLLKLAHHIHTSIPATLDMDKLHRITSAATRYSMGRLLRPYVDKWLVSAGVEKASHMGHWQTLEITFNVGHQGMFRTALRGLLAHSVYSNGEIRSGGGSTSSGMASWTDFIPWGESQIAREITELVIARRITILNSAFEMVNSLLGNIAGQRVDAPTARCLSACKYPCNHVRLLCVVTELQTAGIPLNISAEHIPDSIHNLCAKFRSVAVNLRSSGAHADSADPLGRRDHESCLNLVANWFNRRAEVIDHDIYSTELPEMGKLEKSLRKQALETCLASN